MLFHGTHYFGLIILYNVIRDIRLQFSNVISFSNSTTHDKTSRPSQGQSIRLKYYVNYVIVLIVIDNVIVSIYNYKHET